MYSKENDLYQIVSKFIEEQQSDHKEVIYQCDWVAVAAPDFIKELCDVAGYYKREEIVK